ncbi:MAG: hypothetical protein GWO41_10855, partial [candidate division Zixibacteria bacterium]|nr:hypothetical protein [candidate division Zixibacteria bacterium]
TGLTFSSGSGSRFTDEELNALLRNFLHSSPGGIADPDIFAILDHHLNHAVSAHRQMDRFFNRVRHDFMELDSLFNIDEGWPMVAPSPTMDMRELDTHYLVTFSLPGLQADDVGVRIDGRILTVLCDTEN